MHYIYIHFIIKNSTYSSNIQISSIIIIIVIVIIVININVTINIKLLKQCLTFKHITSSFTRHVTLTLNNNANRLRKTLKKQ